MNTKNVFEYRSVFARTKTNDEIILSTRNCLNLKLQRNRQTKIENHKKLEHSNNVVQSLINL